MSETSSVMGRARAQPSRFRQWLSDTGDALATVFFPAGCRICDELLTRASRVPICDACLSSFAAPPFTKCEVCGQPLPSFAPAESQAKTCPACREKTYAFSRARNLGVYQGALARAIVMLKFEEMEPLGTWFAHRLAELAKLEGEAMEADVVVPVPLHRDRQRERGYNQAAMISEPLAKALGLPHRAVLLMRTRPRPDKQVLSLAEHWSSVRGAFATRPGSQVDKLRVLLVDDVLTTGATLDACSRALLDSGAKSVVGLTVARAASNPGPAPAKVKRS
ncbi:MAG TPA: ComF family protein [Terriglobales bacterium]|nr:ComF family protein [Terriglobales bacterium]